MNVKKTTLIPLWDIPIAELQGLVARAIPELSSITVSRVARYLGFMIGPDAHDSRWDAAGNKYWRRVLAARNTHGGFLFSLIHYHVHALSTLAYLGQFANPPKHLLALERRATQLITAGPYNAIPTRALCNLRALGCSAELRSLELMATSSQLRLALRSRAMP